MHNVRLDGQTCRALKLKFSVVKSSKELISEKKNNTTMHQTRKKHHKYCQYSSNVNTTINSKDFVKNLKEIKLKEFKHINKQAEKVQPFAIPNPSCDEPSSWNQPRPSPFTGIQEPLHQQGRGRAFTCPIATTSLHLKVVTLYMYTYIIGKITKERQDKLLITQIIRPKDRILLTWPNP